MPSAVRRAVAQGAELGPGDLRMDAAAEAAVGAGDDVFLADDFSDRDDAIGYPFRVLDKVGRMAGNTRNQDVPGREFHLAPDFEFGQEKSRKRFVSHFPRPIPLGREWGSNSTHEVRLIDGLRTWFSGHSMDHYRRRHFTSRGINSAAFS